MTNDTPNQAKPVRRRRLRRGLLGLLGAVAILLAVLLINTLTTPSQQVAPGEFEPLVIDEARAVERLREAVRIPTISETPGEFDGPGFAALHALLERAYPRVHAQLEREVVADHSLMYRWEGQDPKAAPIILAAHMDVVPPGELSSWTHSPFAADLAEGYVWGRGTMDDKGALIAILEAVEAMLEAGLVPPRTVYLCFGHDEEIGGSGAQAMAALLAQRGVEAAFALDEGLGITLGLIPGVPGPLAIVGLGEKGFAVIELRVETEGGHSSSPPEQTAIGILAAAVARVEANPMPASLQGPFRQTLEVAGPEMDWPLRLVTTNMWLLRPVLGWVMAAKPTTASTVRTTTAVTVIDGGVKPNVLPTSARALVNHRINYGDTLEQVVAHVRAAVDDPRVEVTLVEGNEVSRISAADDPAYTTVARALREVYPEVVVTPGLFVAAADARHYEGVARQVYRQSAFFLSKQDIPRYHGVDERVSLSDYAGMIQFYGRIMQAP